MFTTDQKHFSNLENEGLNHNTGRPKKPVAPNNITMMRVLDFRIKSKELGFELDCWFVDELALCIPKLSRQTPLGDLLFPLFHQRPIDGARSEIG